MDYNFLSQAELFERISQHTEVDSQKSPQFTLILGSGFSYGVIPTTAQIVQQDLPWWVLCRDKKDGHTPKEYVDTPNTPDDDAAKANARAFWKEVVARHQRQPDDGKKKKSPIHLNTDGVPDLDSVSEAYQFVLSPDARRDFINRTGATVFWGSDSSRETSTQSGPSVSGLHYRREAWPVRHDFHHKFRPAAPAVFATGQRPLFRFRPSDTLQYPDDDDVFDAVHVIHAHGSIYRYLLVNSPEEIEHYATVNQPKLEEYFRKHAVIVVGFSGWDDAITRALGSVGTFDSDFVLARQKWRPREEHSDSGCAGHSEEAQQCLLRAYQKCRRRDGAVASPSHHTRASRRCSASRSSSQGTAKTV